MMMMMTPKIRRMQNFLLKVVIIRSAKEKLDDP